MKRYRDCALICNDNQTTEQLLDIVEHISVSKGYRIGRHTSSVNRDTLTVYIKANNLPSSRLVIGLCSGVNGVSICWFLYSLYSVRRAKKYKDDVITVFNMLDLKTLADSFYVESSRFRMHTRDKDWYRGIDATLIISPFSDVLIRLGELYPKFEDSHTFKEKVQRLYSNIQQYEKATLSIKKECNILMADIANYLQLKVYEGATTFAAL